MNLGRVTRSEEDERIVVGFSLRCNLYQKGGKGLGSRKDSGFAFQGVASFAWHRLDKTRKVSP